MILTQAKMCHQLRRSSMRVSSRLHESSGYFSRLMIFATLHTVCTLYTITSYGVNRLTNAPPVAEVEEGQHFVSVVVAYQSLFCISRLYN